MAIPTSTEFLTRFPEFTEQSLPVIEGALAEATTYTPESVWEEKQSLAITQLTAHLLAVRTMQIGSQIGAPSGSPLDKGLASTHYGQSYLALGETLPSITGFTF